LFVCVVAIAMMRSLALFAVVAAAVVVEAQRCPLQFDGRVGKDVQLAVFDGGKSLFNTGFVKGKGESFFFFFFFFNWRVGFLWGCGLGGGGCEW
jgi:hypothetical protein